MREMEEKADDGDDDDVSIYPSIVRPSVNLETILMGYLLVDQESGKYRRPFIHVLATRLFGPSKLTTCEE